MIVPVATVKTHASSIVEKIGGINNEILLDSGLSVALLSQVNCQPQSLDHYHKCYFKLLQVIPVHH